MLCTHCDNQAISKGLCDTHRKRVERHGDVEAGRPAGWGNLKLRRQREYARLRALSFREKRHRHLKKKFGITIDEYEAMLAAQGGVCAICNQPETRVSKQNGLVMSMAVDHDPKTGVNRGLLCAHHNVMLGLAKDSIEMLEAAIAYLRKHRA